MASGPKDGSWRDQGHLEDHRFLTLKKLWIHTLNSALSHPLDLFLWRYIDKQDSWKCCLYFKVVFYIVGGKQQTDLKVGNGNVLVNFAGQSRGSFRLKTSRMVVAAENYSWNPAKAYLGLNFQVNMNKMESCLSEFHSHIPLLQEPEKLETRAGHSSKLHFLGFFGVKPLEVSAKYCMCSARRYWIKNALKVQKWRGCVVCF